MGEPNGLQPPQRTAGDTKHAAARVVLSAIPWVGGPAVELLAAILRPPWEKRRDEWMQNIAEAVRRLLEQGRTTVEQLQANEAFIDAIQQASVIATRNHEMEKIEALRNAVVNSALPDAPEESLQKMFMAMVDDMTVWHMRILGLFQNPQSWFARCGKPPLEAGMVRAPVEVLLAAYPEMSAKRAFYDQAWRDLHSRGLVYIDSLHITTSPYPAAPRTTELGNQFLSFIADNTSRGRTEKPPERGDA